MPTHYHGTQEEEQALNTFIKLTRSVESLNSRIFSHGVIGDLTPTQFGVLEVLYHLGPQCQGSISIKLLKSTGNMTLVIDNLEKLGLVRRERSNEDRRMITIHLTPKGEERIAAIFPAQAAAITREMSVLTRDEQVQLADLCKKLGLSVSKKTPTA